MKKQETVPAWPKQSMLERLSACRSMLYLHGYLSDAENGKVHARMMKTLLKKATQGKS